MIRLNNFGYKTRKTKTRSIEIKDLDNQKNKSWKLGRKNSKDLYNGVSSDRWTIIKSVVNNNIKYIQTIEDAVTKIKDTYELERIERMIYTIKRKSKVVKDCIQREKGICVNCKKLGPYKNPESKYHFLEVAHIIALKNNGSDNIDNVVGLCPNCHRTFDNSKDSRQINLIFQNINSYMNKINKK